MFLLFLFLSFFSYSQIDNSTQAYTTYSLYDLNYIEDVLNSFSNSCEILKSTETLTIFISLKKLGYTRSDIYSVVLCMCEKEIKIDQLKFLMSKSEQFKLFREFLGKNECDYFLYKRKAFDYLSEKNVFYFKADLDLLNKIIEKYFK